MTTDCQDLGLELGRKHAYPLFYFQYKAVLNAPYRQSRMKQILQLYTGTSALPTAG